MVGNTVAGRRHRVRPRNFRRPRVEVQTTARLGAEHPAGAHPGQLPEGAEAQRAHSAAVEKRRVETQTLEGNVERYR